MARTICLLILLAVCWGCDSQVEPELPESSGLPAGEFEAQVKGDIDRTVRGDAVFETLYGLSGEPIYWLSLKDVTETEGERRYRLLDFTYHFFTYHMGGPPRRGIYPRRGVYSLPVTEQGDNGNGKGEGGKGGGFSARYQDSDVGGSVFKPLGGSIEVYASDKTRVEGSFNFNAYDSVATEPGVFKRMEIVVSGKFHAVKGDVGIILN